MTFAVLAVLNVSLHFWYRYDLLCKNENWSLRKFLFRYFLFTLWILIHHSTVVLFYDFPSDDYKYILEQSDGFNEDIPPYIVFDSVSNINGF